MQLWGENIEKFENTDSRHAWEEVTRLLNERQKNKVCGSVPKKNETLRTLYKQSKD